MPTNEPPSPSRGSIAWIVEARRGRFYHIVNRATPPDGPFRAIGQTFLRLAGITEDELQPDAPGVTFRPYKHPKQIPGLPPFPEEPPPAEPRPR